MFLAKILRGSKSQDLLMQTVNPNTKSGSREFSKLRISGCDLRNQMTVSTGGMEVHTAPLYSKIRKLPLYSNNLLSMHWQKLLMSSQVKSN